MLKGSRDRLRTLVCPELRRAGKCTVQSCIYLHPESLRKTPNAEEVAAASENGEKVHRTGPMGQLPQRARKTIIDPKMRVHKSGSPKSISDLAKLTAGFMPIMLATSPVGFDYRAKMLKAVRQRLEKAHVADAAKLSMELEFDTAKKSTNATYAMEIRNLAKAIDRGEYNDGYKKSKEIAERKSRLMALRNGLEQLIIPVEKLESRFITHIPDTKDKRLPERVDCDRCRAETTVAAIVGQTEKKDSTLICTFHPLRRQWDPNTRRLSEVYPCCGETRDQSNGCQRDTSHVYKLSEPWQLQLVIPFVKTPEDPDKGALFAAAVDCEMAYTTLGMELIRVSLLDWDSGNLVLDRLVFPLGKIIDLNTRWSGVDDINAGTSFGGVHYATSTFEEARGALFKFVNEQTILVGHGLENDLNTLRLIHHRVVDTAMLYPPNRTRTYALRQLAWTYLSKEIQSGEHDSMEDALVAMDIIKKNILPRNLLGNTT